MKCGNTLQESLTNIMVNLACPESVETLKNFTILSTLQERLKDTNVISEIFHGKIHGWSKASPVPCRKRERANDKAGTSAVMQPLPPWHRF